MEKKYRESLYKWQYIYVNKLGQELFIEMKNLRNFFKKNKKIYLFEGILLFYLKVGKLYYFLNYFFVFLFVYDLMLLLCGDVFKIKYDNYKQGDICDRC